MVRLPASPDPARRLGRHAPPLLHPAGWSVVTAQPPASVSSASARAGDLESVFGPRSRVSRLVGLPEGLLLVRPGANAVDLLFLLTGSAPGRGGGLVSGVGDLELALRVRAAAQAFFSFVALKAAVALRRRPATDLLSRPWSSLAVAGGVPFRWRCLGCTRLSVPADVISSRSIVVRGAAPRAVQTRRSGPAGVRGGSLIDSFGGGVGPATVRTARRAGLVGARVEGVSAAAWISFRLGSRGGISAADAGRGAPGVAGWVVPAGPLLARAILTWL